MFACEPHNIKLDVLPAGSLKLVLHSRTNQLGTVLLKKWEKKSNVSSIPIRKRHVVVVAALKLTQFIYSVENPVVLEDAHNLKDLSRENDIITLCFPQY